jgi:cytochrome oxidase Cu insertion factor (SCO1/SenC/PrrC family)
VRIAAGVLIALSLFTSAAPDARAAPALVATARLAELPVAWHDDHGQPFDLHALAGHAVVLTMAYASCHRVCPTTMRRLQQIQHDFDRSGNNAEFLVIGYDPDNDDAAVWRRYRASRHLTRSNWHFLVGSRADVEQTARQLGFEYWRYDEHVIHDARILYFDERGALLKADDSAAEPGMASKQR